MCKSAFYLFKKLISFAVNESILLEEGIRIQPLPLSSCTAANNVHPVLHKYINITPLYGSCNYGLSGMV